MTTNAFARHPKMIIGLWRSMDAINHKCDSGDSSSLTSTKAVPKSNASSFAPPRHFDMRDKPLERSL